jgi:hypothetical protein
MKETTTLEMSESNNLFGSVLLFLVLFTIIILFSFILRLFTLGFYKVNFNKKFLRKYIQFSSVITARRN